MPNFEVWDLGWGLWPSNSNSGEIFVQCN